MNKAIALLSTILIAAALIGIYVYAKSQGIEVLEPQGYISSHQKDLFYLALTLGLIALIPIFVMTFLIIQRYHTGNQKSDKRYSLNWQIKSEASVFWGIFVSIIIMFLAVVMVKSTIAIDPYQPLTSQPSKVIKVVALPWKWLFFYPDENIATVNELAIPVNQPITFQLTADAPMSSFWIPKLGGMIYAMQGMTTQLNVMATSAGQYEGKNTEINGKGYAGMKFMTKALDTQDYQAWVAQVKKSGTNLNQATYQQLAQPTINHPAQAFAQADQDLYQQILNKFADEHTMHSEHAN